MRSAGEGEIGEQVAWRDAEGGTHAEEVDERDVLLASLEGADLVAVKVCALAESFLTEPGGLASAADGIAKDLQSVALGHHVIAHSDWRTRYTC